MSKKVVVVQYDHVFCGYRNDCDCYGNAVFGDFLISAEYVSPKKARKVLSDKARKKGFTVMGDGHVAVAKPVNPDYSEEHQYLSIMSPDVFLFELGALQGDVLQAEAALGKIATKDRKKYEALMSVLADSYDPY